MNSNSIAIASSTVSKLPEQNESDSENIVNVAFDVGSDSLFWAIELSGATISGQCENHTTDIRKNLEQIREQAQRQQDCQVRVICESTGVYHQRLLQVADQLGMPTALVHGEAVAKFRTILFADHGKTDLRDPKAALTVAKVGKLIKDRKLEGHYAQLRELHRLVLRCEARIKVAKCELHSDLRKLFSDLRLDKSVLYGPTGRALIEEFAARPHEMVAAGEEAFCARMKSRSKRIKNATLKKIWRAAVTSAPVGEDRLAVTLGEIQGAAVQQLYREITAFLQQQQELESRMQELYLELQELDRKLPSPRKGVVTLRMLSRLVAEIGPPDDFRSVRQLMRYAGLNLCERQSGKWRGRTTISRRGRSELRYVLNLMSIPVIGRNKFFGDYYWKKKESDKMPGQKALVCVMRKILKMFYGWYNSGQPFDESRVFTMASKHGKAA